MKDRRTILLILAWFILILFSFALNYKGAKNEQSRIALLTSREVFDHILITRLWNARHGSLYVPVSQKMRPNKYLKVPMRDIKVDKNLTLTQINPSFMTRQISEISIEQGGIKFHMTSLNPIRVENKPTQREEKALQSFERGELERGLFYKTGTDQYYFYMAPLKAKNECLKCHDKQGYNKGDIIGGISLKLPMVAKLPIGSLILGHSVVGLFGFIGIFYGVRRINEAYEKIKDQAVTDALTGIPNRRYFSETLINEYTRCNREAMPLSVVMCDIDYFKKYNDTYGHNMGDSCLKNVAQIISGSLSRAGDFCARYGGEEFVIILPNTIDDGAFKIAEKIRVSVEKNKIEHEKSSKSIVTLSLGVATMLPGSSISHEGLIKSADIALYRAKEQGRNMVCSYGEII